MADSGGGGAGGALGGEGGGEPGPRSPDSAAATWPHWKSPHPPICRHSKGKEPPTGTEDWTPGPFVHGGCCWRWSLGDLGLGGCGVSLLAASGPGLASGIRARPAQGERGCVQARPGTGSGGLAPALEGCLQRRHVSTAVRKLAGPGETDSF